jgi:16S rRNA G966 N2-methylase RsmD
MRGLARWLLAAGTATAAAMAAGLTAVATEPVTVEQLKAVLVEGQERGDSALASNIAGLRLTERLSSKQLSQLRANLPGDKSREALIVLVDESVFLDPPQAEIVEKPRPDVQEQKEIMARVVDYVAKASHKLPNFLAKRTTTHFEDWPQGYQRKGMVAGRYIGPKLVTTSRTGVTFRNGKEELSTTAKQILSAPMEQGLYSWGLFGPVLATVLVDASRSTLEWSRWEKGERGPLAVFRFEVPMENSKFELRFCCVPAPEFQGKLSFFSRISAYHGEIAVDPADGTIMRLTLMADLDKGSLPALLEDFQAGSPITRADLFVEYAPVDIGGKLYTCPVRSVALSRAKAEIMVRDEHGRHAELGPVRTYINDVEFRDYHVFRSESRILTGNIE